MSLKIIEGTNIAKSFVSVCLRVCVRNQFSSLDWPLSPCVAKEDPEFLILLPPFPRFRVYNHA